MTCDAYNMTMGIRDTLAAAGYPCRVMYGPLVVQRGDFRDRIVIERDDETSDQEPITTSGTSGKPHGRAVSAAGEQHRVGQRGQAIVARVYGQCTEAGARVCEHEAVVDQYVDALVVAVRDWVTEARRIQHQAPFTFTGGRYVPKREREDVESWPGRVYELRWVLPRGIYRAPYTVVQVADAKTELELEQPDGSTTAIDLDPGVILP